jgi:hypothetical protein
MEDAIRFVIDMELYTHRFTRTDLARLLGVSSSTIKRQMEGSTPAGGLDDLVSATSEIVGIAPIRMWRRALQLWALNGDSPDYWTNLKRGQARLVKGIESGISLPDDAGDPTW